MIHLKIKRIYILILILIIVLLLLLKSFIFIKFNAKSIVKLGFTEHTTALKYIHEQIKPEIYLEIGVDNGNSINITLPETHAIGIDPVLKTKLNDNVAFYKMESDKFFKDKNIINKEFKDKKINLAFIDGMHLYEYVLRDFINVEKYSNPNSIILLHDTLPVTKEMAQRKQKWNGEAWTGDVYKIVPILKKYRPDLNITIIDVPPSGLCVISNLNPSSDTLEKNYNKIIKEYENYSFEEVVKFEKENIKFVKPEPLSIKRLLKKINYSS